MFAAIALDCFFYNSDNGVVMLVRAHDLDILFYNYYCLLLLETHKFVISLMAEFGVYNQSSFRTLSIKRTS